MDIYAQNGHKVKYDVPNAGLDHDKEKCQRLLKLGETYTVDYTDVHSWYTDVYLVEFPGENFNSVNFSDS
jgi:hypothetical protein